MSAPPDLRPYQSDIIARLWAAVAAGQRRVLMVAPTASGKPVIAGAIVAEATVRSERVLFLVHRRELTVQASRKLHAAGVDHGIIQAGFTPRSAERVQIASVQTLYARAVRTNRIEMPAADMVFVDEAHHIRARTYRRILEAYPNAVVIGLTATPCRGDGRGLGPAFDVLLECPNVAELTADGYLVPSRIYAPSRPDLTGMRVERGDYVESQAGQGTDHVVGLKPGELKNWDAHRLQDAADKGNLIQQVGRGLVPIGLVLREPVRGAWPLRSRKSPQCMEGRAAWRVSAACC